jgi:hypothetical protein
MCIALLGLLTLLCFALRCVHRLLSTHFVGILYQILSGFFTDSSWLSNNLELGFTWMTHKWKSIETSVSVFCLDFGMFICSQDIRFLSFSLIFLFSLPLSMFGSFLEFSTCLSFFDISSFVLY